MAWIKMEHCTPDKPEVIGMAEILGIDQDAVVGKLARLWIWADQQTFDGNAGGNGVSVTRSFIDRCTCIAGFADAMERVGWLGMSEGKLTFPNFDRHNGQTAKQRALTSRRVEKHRAESNGKCNAAGVTLALPEKEKEKESLDSFSLSPPNPLPGEFLFCLPNGWDTPEVQSQLRLWCHHVETSPKGHKILDWNLAANQGIQGFKTPAELCKSIAHAISNAYITLRPYIPDETRVAERAARKPKPKAEFDDGLTILGTKKP